MVTVSVYSPFSSSAGMMKTSFEGSFTAQRSSVTLVTTPEADVSVMPTAGSVPAIFSFEPVRVKLRPAVAVALVARVAVSCVPATNMVLPFSPMMLTPVARMASRMSAPWVKAM